MSSRDSNGTADRRPDGDGHALADSPDPVVTRRDVLNTVVTTSAIAGLRGVTRLAEGADAQSDESALVSFPNWTAYETLLARYVNNKATIGGRDVVDYEMDNPAESPPPGFDEFVPDDAPLRTTGYAATRTQSALQYVGTTYEPFGNPDDESSEGAWRHTFVVSSMGTGIKPLFLINADRSEIETDRNGTAYPQLVPRQPIYGPAGRSMWNPPLPLYENIRSKYIDNRDTAPYRTYYSDTEERLITIPEDQLNRNGQRNFDPPFGREAGFSPKLISNRRIVRVATDLEVSTVSDNVGDGLYSRGDTAVSVRRDEDLFTFSQGGSLLKTLVGETGLDLLQTYGAHPRADTPVGNRAVQRRTLGTSFDSFDALESRQWWGSVVSSGVSAVTAGFGLATAGAGVLGSSTLSSIYTPLATLSGTGVASLSAGGLVVAGGYAVAAAGIVLALYGAVTAGLNLFDALFGPRPDEFEPYRGVYAEHPLGFGPRADWFGATLEEDGNPASGVTAMFDVYQSAEDDGIVTVRTENRVKNHTNQKSIWFLYLPALPADPDEVDPDTHGPPTVFGPGHPEWQNVNDPDDDTTDLVPPFGDDDSAGNVEGSNDYHQIDIGRRKDLVRSPPIAGFNMDWESRESLTTVLSETFTEEEIGTDIDIPEQGASFSDVRAHLEEEITRAMEPLDEAIERMQEQAPAVGETVTFDPGSTTLGGAPLTGYRWNLYRVYPVETFRNKVELVEVEIDDQDQYQATSDSEGEDVFGSPDAGVIKHTFDKPGRYRMELTVEDGRDVDFYIGFFPDDGFESESSVTTDFRVEPAPSDEGRDRPRDERLDVTFFRTPESIPLGGEAQFLADAVSEYTPPVQPIPGGADTTSEPRRYLYEWAILPAVPDEGALLSGVENPTPEFQRLSGDPYDPLLTAAFVAPGSTLTDDSEEPTAGTVVANGPGEYEVFVRVTDLITGRTARDSTTLEVIERDTPSGTCELEGPPDPGPASTIGTLEAPGQIHQYEFSNPDLATINAVRVRGACNDVDLYITLDGSAPRPDDFDRMSRSLAPEEEITRLNPSGINKLGIAVFYAQTGDRGIEYYLEVDAEGDGELTRRE